MHLRRLFAMLLALACASLSGAQVALGDGVAGEVEHASVRGALDPGGGAAESEPSALIASDFDGDEDDDDSDEDVVACRPLAATVAIGKIQIRSHVTDDDAPPQFASSLFRPPRH